MSAPAEQPAAAAVQQEPAPPAAPARQPPRPGPSRPPLSAHQVAIPCLSNPQFGLTFGRMDSDYHIIDHVLQIDALTAIATLVHQQLTAITTIELAITEEQFVRMTKTLLLKRAQDVFESEKSVRHAHFVRLNRTVLLPGPIADLIHSIGYFHSNTTGVMHHTTPPAQAAVPENWWTVDQAIMAVYNRDMNRMKHLYTMKEFPSMSMCSDRPLMLTRKQVPANNISMVKAWTNEPKMSDALIRLVHEELYADHAFITFDNCHLNMTQRVFVPQIQTDYVGSYTIDTNS